MESIPEHQLKKNDVSVVNHYSHLMVSSEIRSSSGQWGGLTSYILVELYDSCQIGYFYELWFKENSQENSWESVINISLQWLLYKYYVVRTWHTSCSQPCFNCESKSLEINIKNSFLKSRRVSKCIPETMELICLRKSVLFM